MKKDGERLYRETNITAQRKHIMYGGRVCRNIKMPTYIDWLVLYDLSVCFLHSNTTNLNSRPFSSPIVGREGWTTCDQGDRITMSNHPCYNMSFWIPPPTHLTVCYTNYDFLKNTALVHFPTLHIHSYNYSYNLYDKQRCLTTENINKWWGYI